MKLAGVAILKNEADILEAFVRHQLQFLDRLVLVDHASDDASPQILSRLHAEGLPLSLHRLDDLAFDHARVMTDALRMAAASHPADAYLALDADEFLHGVDADGLRTAIAGLAQDEPGYLRWQTQVPAPGLRDGGDPHPLRRLTHRIAAEPGVQHKVVLRHGLVQRDDWQVATGNHWVERKAGPDAMQRIAGRRLDAVRLAHLPLRSPGQIVRKVALGWFGHRLALGAVARELPLNWHWNGLFQRIVRGQLPQWDEIAALAASAYSSELPQPASGPVALLHDPLTVYAELRWPELAAVDPLLDLLRWTDRLVDAVTRAPG
jgi:hypothetical protein